MNKIILTGNICKDLETKYYNDKKYLKNSIAVKRDFKNKNDEYETDFFNFTLWGNQAEYLSKYGKKGDKIIISGKLLNNNYETENGMVYSFDIQVENVELLGNKKAQEEAVENKEENEVVVSIDDFLE